MSPVLKVEGNNSGLRVSPSGLRILIRSSIVDLSDNMLCKCHPPINRDRPACPGLLWRPAEAGIKRK